MSRAPRMAAAADTVLQRVGFLKNPYFAALADGSMSLAQFRATQEQFFYAVQYYPRPMAALASRIPDPAQRLDLLHNLVEEHGDFRPDHFHQNTFGQFLATIGGRRPDQAAVPICPAVHAFNSTLSGTCATDEIEVGICCLGVIERAFADVSALIGRAVVRRGWVTESALVHYALHAELDIRHAEEFFAVVEGEMDDQKSRESIRRGLELGAYAFDQLYRGLLVQTA